MTDYKHQIVREMAWAIKSPPLIAMSSHSCSWPSAEFFEQLYLETKDFFIQVDSEPEELQALLDSQKDRRLGKYFETMWYYWLLHNPRYDIVENNVQVIIDGETLGEMDFILFDKVSKKTLHWEMAVKFYLGIGDTREMKNWHGPNLRDRLDLKTAHLCEHQSVFSRDKRVANWLANKGIVIDDCAVIMKGRLYYPWSGLWRNVTHEKVATEQAPAESVIRHSSSWWLTKSQFNQVFAEDERFLPLINRGWMANISTVFKGDFLTKNDLIEIQSNNKIRLPLHLQLENPHGSWDRVFLVDDTWSK